MFYDRFPSSILQRREQAREAGNTRGHGIESSQLVGNLISYQSFSGWSFVDARRPLPSMAGGGERGIRAASQQD